MKDFKPNIQRLHQSRISLLGFGIIIIWLVLQCIWRYVLDLSDLPGAAGTISIVKSVQGQTQGHHFSTWLSYFPSISIETKALFLGWFGTLLAIIGSLLCGWSIGRNKGLIGCGIIVSLWAVMHDYAISIGPDSWSFGLSWLGVGLCWLAMQQRHFVLCALLLVGSVCSMKEAMAVKFLAFPTICFLPMAICTIRNWSKLQFLHLMFLTFAIYLCLPQMNGSTTLQGGLRIPEVDWLPIHMGWFKLKMLYAQGQGHAKFDQLLIGAVVSSLFLYRQQKLLPLLTIASCLVLCVSAFVLEDRIRVRLLTPASIGVLSVTGWGLGHALTSKFGRYITGVVVFFLLMDNWAYLHHISKSQSSWTGSEDHTIAAPSLWQNQFVENQTLFKDQSLYGSVSARKLIREGLKNQNSSAIYTMRLRDERESSLLVYAWLEGHQGQVLDIHKCCQGYGGQFDLCSKRIVQHVEQHGGFLILPQKGLWLRIHNNEKNWKTKLEKAMRQNDSFLENKYWMWINILPKGNPKLFCSSN